MRLSRLPRLALIFTLAHLAAAAPPVTAQAAGRILQPSGHGIADASAVLSNSSGVAVGTVSFIQAADHVRVSVSVGNLPPGLHGFHIHEVGTCTAPSFSSAGGHLGAAQGQKQPNHKGDLPLLRVSNMGTANVTFRTDRFALGDLFGGVGTAVVIHAGADNFANIPLGAAPDQYVANSPTATAVTAATGNAGARIACGVVQPVGAAVVVAYHLASADGGVFAFSGAPFAGSLGGVKLNSPVAAIAATHSLGGYWLAAQDGGVFAFGDAPFVGSVGDRKLNAPVVAMAAPSADARAVLTDAVGRAIGTVIFSQLRPTRVGVHIEVRGLTPGWHGLHVTQAGQCSPPGFTSAGPHLGTLAGQSHPDHAGDLPIMFVGADGIGRAAYGVDRFRVANLLSPAGSAVVVTADPDNFVGIPTGSAPDQYTPNSPTATAVTALDGNSGARIACGVVQRVGLSVGPGYYLAAADGGVFAFGSAPFLGSMGDTKVKAPIVGMAATPSGRGYWLVSGDGGVFSFGDAPALGTLGGTKLNAPVVGMDATPSGLGYWLVSADGGVFSFGDAAALGSMAGTRLNAPVVGIAGARVVEGYRLFTANGGVFSFGEARFAGGIADTKLNARVVGGASGL